MAILSMPLPMLDAVEQPGFLETIDNTVNRLFEPVNRWANEIIFWTPPFFPMPWIVLWMVVGAVVITVYLGFIQTRGIPTAFDTIRGKYSRADDPGEIPHFQALTSALSGTVGLGNIAGVGAAVVIGGPGATFWMIMAGLFGMAMKFAECTLGVKYRDVYDDGTVAGGPFKYLPVAFRRFPKQVAVGLTAIFAIAILFFGVGGGNMFQANQTYAQAVRVTGGADSFLAAAGMGVVFGLVLAFIVGLVIIGGIKSIGAVTGRLVPFMGIMYVCACLVVILGNLGNVPDAIGQIISGAFTADGMTGGVVGVLIIGMQRAFFSNEAGLGSAPIAHSAVKTRRPVSEGFVALFEPFVDTVVICTMTALTIIIANTQGYGFHRDGYEEFRQAQEGIISESSYDPSADFPGGAVVTSEAMESVAPWFQYVLALAIALFAISTLITWSYYGNQAWAFFFGRSRTSTLIYRVIFLTFTVAGCVLSFQQVLEFADAFLFVCGFVNILGVYLLLPVIKREMQEFLEDRRSGKLAAYGAGQLKTMDEVRPGSAGGEGHDAARALAGER